MRLPGQPEVGGQGFRQEAELLAATGRPQGARLRAGRFWPAGESRAPPPRALPPVQEGGMGGGASNITHCLLPRVPSPLPAAGPAGLCGRLESGPVPGTQRDNKMDGLDVPQSHFCPQALPHVHTGWEGRGTEGPSLCLCAEETRPVGPMRTAGRGWGVAGRNLYLEGSGGRALPALVL